MSDQPTADAAANTGMSELEWSNLLHELNTNFQHESPHAKLIRKFKEQPLVPIGGSSVLVALMT